LHIQSCALDAPEDSEEVDEDGYGSGRYHHVGWPETEMLVLGRLMLGKIGRYAPELHESRVDASPVMGYVFVFAEDDVGVAHYRKNYNREDQGSYSLCNVEDAASFGLPVLLLLLLWNT
jgi:hypothetical protein